jgi:general secretion pathway protein K
VGKDTERVMTTAASFRSQRGTALITAILIAAVASLLASQLLVRQARELERLRQTSEGRDLQTFLAAGFDWARAALIADRASSRDDHLGEAWHQPLVALPTADATVAGQLHDAQGRFNVNNLVATNSDVDLLRYRRLLARLGLRAELADALRDYMDRNADGAYEDGLYLGGGAALDGRGEAYRIPNQPLASESELVRVAGYSEAVLAQLRPHIVALPPRSDGRPTNLNVNTVDALVLAAYADVSPEAAERAIAARKTKPFTNPDELRALFNRPDTPTNTDVKSDYFLAEFAVSRDATARQGIALLQRTAEGEAFIIRFEPR